MQTADEIRDAFPGSIAEVGSSALLVDSIVAISESDLQRGEAVALPIALIVMLVVFGGFLAAGMPLVGAIVSILGGLGALFGFTYLLDINTTVVNVVTAVGLGLSIDYGLLIVSRFREEYRHSAGDGLRTREHRLDAIVRTADSAGRTVAFSGTRLRDRRTRAAVLRAGDRQGDRPRRAVGHGHLDRLRAHPAARAALAHRREARAARGAHADPRRRQGA